MDLPGYYSLGSFSITTADTYAPDAGEELTGLAGMLALTAQLKWVYGSGSGSPSGVAYLQTSLDAANEGGAPGGTWIDIASMSLADASAIKVFQLSGLTPRGTLLTPGDGTLTPDTTIDGLLGDRLRIKVVSFGTFANSSLTGSVVVR